MSVRAASPFLTAGYRPVATETTAHGLQVRGTLPPELDGTVLRIGPNPLGRPDPARHQVLAGDAMVHGLRLRDGRAQWYRNRWLRTDRVCRALGALPTPGPRHGLSDNANDNIVRHGGRTLALGDGGVLPVELCPELGTIARSDLDATLPNGLCAHPERDPLTGELFAVAYGPGLPYAQFLTVDPAGRVRRCEPVDIGRTSMMHAFSLTERFAVLYDLPVVFSPAAAAAGRRIPYVWDDRGGARLGVLPRAGDAPVRWFDIEPCYVFHAVNAYETGRTIVVDAVRHNRVFAADPLAPGESAPTLCRWTLGLDSGTVTERRLDDRPQEFPRIDDQVRGSAHRFAVTVGMRDGAGGAFAGPELLRHDLAAGRTETHRYGPGRQTGEAVFVPRRPDAPEGDGWLLSFVYDMATDRSDLVVLDTSDFAGPPAAVVRLPVRVPHGLHATWIPAG
jgi:carotenoid cleavage dioxygenase